MRVLLNKCMGECLPRLCFAMLVSEECPQPCCPRGGGPWWPRPLGQSRQGRGRSTNRPASKEGEPPAHGLGWRKHPSPAAPLGGGVQHCKFVWGPCLCRSPCPKTWIGCIPCCVALSQRTTSQLQKNASKTCYIKTINYNIHNLTSKNVMSPKTSPFPCNLGKPTKS